MVIAYYISYISNPQMKKFAEKHEKCVFSYYLSKIDTLFENIPNLEPTVHSLAGRSWADRQKVSSNGSSSSAFSVKEMPRMFLTLQFLTAKGLRQ